MRFQVDVLYHGFPGKLTNAGLGWGAVALVRGGGHNILVDTGGPAIRGTLAGMLAERGLGYGDVDICFLSHLHWDHAYNVDYFPQAEFIVARAEWEAASVINPRDIFMEDKALPLLRLVKTRLIERDGEEIIPGVSCLLTPGHTPGSMSLLVDQGEDGRWLFTGDACKNRGELKSEDAGQCFDAKIASDSLRKMKKAATRVLPGHDGWINVLPNGEIVAEGGNDVTFVFGQGLTVNGGQTTLTLKLDM